MIKKNRSITHSSTLNGRVPKKTPWKSDIVFSFQYAGLAGAGRGWPGRAQRNPAQRSGEKKKYHNLRGIFVDQEPMRKMIQSYRLEFRS